jgi:hypothetical protein
MRIVPFVFAALAAIGLAGCQTAPEHIAIQQQYVGSDLSPYGRNPTTSALGNLAGNFTGNPQMRCAVVRYDPYGRPYCDAVQHIR